MMLAQRLNRTLHAILYAATLTATTGAHAASVAYYTLEFDMSLESIRLEWLYDVPNWTPLTEYVGGPGTLSPAGMSIGDPARPGSISFYEPDEWGWALSRWSIDGAWPRTFQYGTPEYFGTPEKGVLSDGYSRKLVYTLDGTTGSMHYEIDGIDSIDGTGEDDYGSFTTRRYFYPTFTYTLSNVRITDTRGRASVPAPVVPLPAPALLLVAGLALLTAAGRRRAPT